MEGRFRRDWERVDFQAGSICSAFEGGEEFDAGPLVNAQRRTLISRISKYLLSIAEG
jgi:hypothetical protein